MGRSEHPEKRFGMHRPGAHLDVERLLKEAAPGSPEFRQLEDELLQCDHSYKNASSFPPPASRSGCPPPRSKPGATGSSPAFRAAPGPTSDLSRDAGSAAGGARPRAPAPPCHQAAATPADPV